MADLHLTFDDGPDPRTTPRVLDALAARGALATFFVLGPAVRRAPELVQAIQAGGHRVELHGDEHLDHRFARPATLAVDTQRAILTLAEAGIDPVWWRLPWGRPGPGTAPMVTTYGLRIVGWDVDSHDWRGDGPGEQPVDDRRSLAGGGVVLLHDGFGPGATRDDIDNTLALIDHYADLGADHGLALTPLPDPADAAALSIPTTAPTALATRPTGATS